jgi:hypothetical protein
MVQPPGRSSPFQLYNPPGRVPEPVRHIEYQRQELNEAKDPGLGARRGAAALAHFAFRFKLSTLRDEVTRQKQKGRLNAEVQMRNNLTEVAQRTRPTGPTTATLEGIDGAVVRELFRDFVNGGLGHVALGHKAAFLQTRRSAENH